jgi:hypothetical protein
VLAFRPAPFDYGQSTTTMIITSSGASDLHRLVRRSAQVE